MATTLQTANYDPKTGQFAGYTPNTGMASTNPVNNITTQGTQTDAGIVNYDPNTGAKLTAGQSVTVAPGGNTYGSTPQSTTTLSSDKSADIAGNNAKLDTYSTKGVTTDPNTGISTNADGTVYTPPSLETADTTDEDAKIQANLDQMKANTDAITASQIASIQNRYAGYIEEQKKVNATNQAGMTNFLLTSGSLQHTESGQNVLPAAIDAGTKKIQDLENEENDLINTAKQAQLTGNNKLLEDANAEIEKTRQAKLDTTSKMNDDIIAATKTARANAQQSKIDNAIATEYANGNTDPTQIIKNLTAKGITVTSQQIADSIKNIATNLGTDTTGMSADAKEFYTLKKQVGGLPMSILSLPDTASQLAAYIKLKSPAKTTSSSTSIFGDSSGGKDDIGLIAQAIINGNQPPVVTGLYGKTASVRAELERRGFDYTKANQDFVATGKLLATLNGAQQTKLRESINQVSESLPLVSSLATQWDAGKYPVLNKVSLTAAKNGLYGQKAQSIAVQLDAEIADVVSELATVYKGGNSSTDSSLQLAKEQLDSNWTKQTLLDAIALAQKNIQYRKNSFNLATGGISNSQYNPITNAGGSTATDFINNPTPDQAGGDFWSKAK